ncbi:MAG: chalcone isomerase family protein [Pseudomonadota bacterium]
MNILNRSIIVMLILVTVPAGAAGTVTVGDVVFPENMTISNTALKLKGAAVLRYLAVFRAYAGAFYLPPESPSWEGGSPVPCRLELSYYRAIKAEDLDKATRKKVADNVDAAVYARLADRLDRFGAMYRDVRPGDRYALNYVPGEGTELTLNGASLGRIFGADFAAAVFAIWLGANPIDEDFKAALLGRS